MRHGPLARHTFGGLAWLPSLRRLWLGGGGLYRPDGRQDGTDSWLFDPAMWTWERLPDLPFAAPAPRTAYDPVADLLNVWDDRHLAAFDPKCKVYTRQSRQVPALGSGSTAVNPERRLVVALSDAGVWSTRIGPHQPLMTPRHVTTDGAPRDLGRFGLAYHPESRLFVAWDGNRGVWTLDPADWSWTEYPNPDGPAPFATSSNGVFGRRRYDPELDAFRRQPRVRDATKAIWVAKGDDTMTENVAFSGMAVPDRNGAGIRHEGRDLTLRRVLMEDGEEGLPAAVRPDGNVRQLQNRVKRAVIMAEGKRVTAADLELREVSGEPEPFNLKELRERAVGAAARGALALTKGNISRSARLLGISRPTLYDLMRQHNPRA